MKKFWNKIDTKKITINLKKTTKTNNNDIYQQKERRNKWNCILKNVNKMRESLFAIDIWRQTKIAACRRLYFTDENQYLFGVLLIIYDDNFDRNGIKRNVLTQNIEYDSPILSRYS